MRDNEARTLRLLDALALEIAPRVVDPLLLDRGILLAEYVVGDPLDRKILPPALIESYARMQNELNRRELFGRPPFSACKWTEADDGFYRDGVLGNIEGGLGQLRALRPYDLPILDALLALAVHLREHREAIAEGFAEMPFAWLHHDFKELHVRGEPERLLDWGSSYGHGPFLFDLAPFLLSDAAGREVFVRHSELCRRAEGAALERWLTLGACAAFANFARWHVEAFGVVGRRREEWQALLTYEYEAYAPLLEWSP